MVRLVDLTNNIGSNLYN